jgi:hypothetical protein
MKTSTNDGRYKIGDKIHIVHLKGEPTDDYDNREGRIEGIDDIDQLHGSWGFLAVIPNEDNFYKIATL